MQATTLQNVKRAKGIDVDLLEKTGNQTINRQQVADAKKLKRYIDQLTIAKAECEAALRKLGWDGAFPTVSESDSKVIIFFSYHLTDFFSASPRLGVRFFELSRIVQSRKSKKNTTIKFVQPSTANFRPQLINCTII